MTKYATTEKGYEINLKRTLSNPFHIILAEIFSPVTQSFKSVVSLFSMFLLQENQESNLLTLKGEETMTKPMPKTADGNRSSYLQKKQVIIPKIGYLFFRTISDLHIRCLS